MAAWEEPLKPMPVDNWEELRAVLLADSPRSISGYNVLETLTWWHENGFDYGFKVYSPFGDAQNGYIAIKEETSSNEIIIQYPKDDTTILEETLKTTKLIDWNKSYLLPFTSYHVIACVEKVKEDKGVTLSFVGSQPFMLERGSPLFNVSLPPDVSFKLLSPEHIELIDSKWPHRYPTSTEFFRKLIERKVGYGLFKDEKLVSWIFIGESGNLTHLYTLEEHRKKGYAELVLKLMSNEVLKGGRTVLANCVKGNFNAYKLYDKVGFQRCIELTYCDVSKKES